ncbi:hypothetical protein RIF29_29739 [Crotalaria pallida]|uniref:Uncharacterized protein n=1 Tax=Crotalaria pallida TaxID=3830 RepID=A0AAN9HU62_CROPI
MAGGGAPAPKADEPQQHPPKDQLPNISYGITSPPPWPEAILLGFQHFLVMLGTTVLIPTALVPQMGGGNVSNNGLRVCLAKLACSCELVTYSYELLACSC